MLCDAELWVELGWNYMKFHPYSTHNSTSHKHLIVRVVTVLKWKGGITNEKKYFSEIRAEKVLTTVKNRILTPSDQETIIVKVLRGGRLVVLVVLLYDQITKQQNNIFSICILFFIN